MKVVAKNGWFAARPSGTEDVCKIYEVKVTLGELDPDAVRIEFSAAGAGSAEPSSLERRACRSRRRVERLRLLGTCARNASGERLHGAGDTKSLRRCRSAGSHSHSVAAVSPSTGRVNTPEPPLRP